MVLPPRPGRRRRALVLTVVSAATCLTACGTSDSDKIKDAVRNYIQAVLDDNGKAACDLLTSDAAKTFVDKVSAVTKTGDCATAFQKEAATLSADDKAVYRSAVLNGVTLNGDQASVNVKFTGVSKDISLKRVNGDWKIATGPTS